jgi:hypothetical protein
MFGFLISIMNKIIFEYKLPKVLKTKHVSNQIVFNSPITLVLGQFINSITL